MTGSVPLSQFHKKYALVSMVNRMVSVRYTYMYIFMGPPHVYNSRACCMVQQISSPSTYTTQFYSDRVSIVQLMGVSIEISPLMDSFLRSWWF